MSKSSKQMVFLFVLCCTAMSVKCLAADDVAGPSNADAWKQVEAATAEERKAAEQRVEADAKAAAKREKEAWAQLESESAKNRAASEEKVKADADNVKKTGEPEIKAEATERREAETQQWQRTEAETKSAEAKAESETALEKAKAEAAQERVKTDAAERGRQEAEKALNKPRGKGRPAKPIITDEETQ